MYYNEGFYWIEEDLSSGDERCYTPDSDMRKAWDNYKKWGRVPLWKNPPNYKGSVHYKITGAKDFEEAQKLILVNKLLK